MRTTNFYLRNYDIRRFWSFLNEKGTTECWEYKGKKDKNGLVGIAAYECEMVWHCNEPGLENRRPIVWLYSVEGSEGSRTSYTNNILSYNDLDENLKKEIENYHLEIIQEMGLFIS